MLKIRCRFQISDLHGLWKYVLWNVLKNATESYTTVHQIATTVESISDLNLFDL